MLIPDKCMKCKLNSDERFNKCKDCSKPEPLINKGYIINTDIYRVRWITKEGKTYTGNISFDVDYNAYGEKDIPLTGINIDDKGNEVKIDTFYSKDVCSAVGFYKRYRSYPLNTEGYLLLRKEHPELLKLYNKSNQPYNDWLFDYSFKDVI